jgi:outer membrane lipoprotein-sorting protein
MDRLPKFSRRARWAVPAGALAVTGAVIAGALASTAQASPVLPARTAAQLLASVSGRTGALPPLTGTVVENASLGLPDLPGQADSTSITSLLTGNHTIRIWYADPSHVRLAVPGDMSESDLILDGHTGWYWQSTTNSVTKLLLPADQRPMAREPVLPELTPQQAASQAIAAVGPTTKVSVQTNITVAGEPAYQLVLAPKSAGSLIGQVRIAVDATHQVPLRVQVYARHAASPVFTVGFTSISFVRPAAANFDFTPPPGAKVSTEKVTAPELSNMTPRRQPTTFGKSWLTVAELPAGDLSDGLAGMSGHASSAAGMAASSAQAAAGTPGAPAGGPAEQAGMAGLIMQSATAVHGSWGSGQLLRTSLLSVLMTSDGQVFIGAVTPSVLYADAAQAAHGS